MLATLRNCAPANNTHESYYDGSYAAQLLNISTPAELPAILKTVSGWAGTAVDVLEERLDLMGFADEDLVDIFEDNALDEEAGQVHLDALIYGIGFVSVTAGRDDEPPQLVRGHNAKNATGIFNPRTRRLDWGLTTHVENGKTVELELWGRNEIVTARREHDAAPWEIVNRTRHGLGVVPLVPFINRPRTGLRGGKSEITAPLRRHADNAVRVLISMDVNREFFSAPQRYAIGMSKEDFIGPDGSPVSPWSIITGRVWSTPPVGDDEKDPKLGEFDPVPPGPFLDQIEGLAQLVAAETGVPAHYFGLRGDQATSADAIRAMEARLVKRAERRQKTFGRSWSEVARLIRAGRDNVPATQREPSRTRWGNPATPTIGATMDAMVKAVQAGLAPGNSRVIWDRVGFTPEEQRLLERDVSNQRLAQRLAASAAAPSRSVQEAMFSDEGIGELDGGLSGDSP
ncbi:phage portal protein [Corynebacterium sp. TAE3-ERU2]|nr:phage portal protein [Corynebacterium sp. TAE3-ERU2]MBV7302925.1 phage portal protein [Corynebacterium sp. TAE3-ERU2]